ncbi:hypothetical protein M408DRAFT_326353 [Serendipita vermifera MAFF 305830]|uniref:Uncharacterized protein n=1 Tax=Serendipita vermifera MAFF 305830 TaxID=933852 RepID=A0A0C2XUL4_SERVB|nr:hypothetical protein M408DRAFT_326353 [Serendipita vermifera MAFF 305830]
MDYVYTYQPSEVSHTKAKAGDTDKWTSSLELLLDSSKSLNMNHRELIKMDNSILDIEMKKATVTRSELENNASFRKSLVTIATKAPGMLPDNRRWHFKERAMTLCFYFWGCVFLVLSSPPFFLGITR